MDEQRIVVVGLAPEHHLSIPSGRNDRSFAHFLGVGIRYFVNLEYPKFGDARHEASRAKAENEIDRLVERLSRDECRL